MSLLQRIREAITPSKRNECYWDECGKALSPGEGVVDRWGNPFCSDEHAAFEHELSLP